MKSTTYTFYEIDLEQKNEKSPEKTTAADVIQVPWLSGVFCVLWAEQHRRVVFLENALDQTRRPFRKTPPQSVFFTNLLVPDKPEKNDRNSP